MITIEGAVIAALLAVVATALVAILRSRATNESVVNLGKLNSEAIAANADKIREVERDLDQHRTEDREDFKNLRQSIETLRLEMNAGLTNLRNEFRSELSSLATEFRMWAAAAHGTPRSTRRKAKPLISRTDKPKR